MTLRSALDVAIERTLDVPYVSLGAPLIDRPAPPPPPLTLYPEEATYLAASERCTRCGHLDALHGETNCFIEDCECGWW